LAAYRHALLCQLKTEFYMHIMTSFYNAMTRFSDAVSNAIPGWGSYTLHYKVRDVKSTSNVPGKKTTQWQPRMKPSPVSPVRLERYRIISEEFPGVPQKPNQTSTGARRDILLSQSERKKVVDEMAGIIKKHRKQKVEEQKDVASGAVSHHAATSSSSSSSAPRQTATVIPAEPAIDRQTPIPPWTAESEWSALAPVPKDYLGRMAKPAGIRGKPGEKRMAPQPAVMLQSRGSLPGAGDATSAPVVLQCHPKPVPAQVEIGPSISLQEQIGKLQIVLGTREVKKPQLAVRSFSEPGRRLAATVAPSVLRDTRSRLKSADARIPASALVQESSELDRVFARRRAQETVAA
jgi:hypothetical protein